MRLWSLVLCAVAWAGAAQASPIARIDIHIGFGGLGHGRTLDLVIEQHDGAYRCEWTMHDMVSYGPVSSDNPTTGGTSVDARAVETFAAALAAPALLEPTLANLGVDQTWLERNKDNSRHFGNDAAPNLKALFYRTMTDPVLAQKAAEREYRSIASDASADMRAEIAFTDGTTVGATSRSYWWFGAPWRIQSGSEKKFTYNADIGRSLAALLPPDAPGLDDLSGATINRELPRLLEVSIFDDWDTLDARNRTGDALTRLEARYQLVKARFYDYDTGDFGKFPSQNDLHAELRLPDMPPDFGFAVRLELEDGKTEGVERFLKSAPGYLALFESIPWMTAYLHKKKHRSVEIVYFHDASLGSRVFAAFAQDMHAMGKDRLAREVEAVREKAVFVRSGGDYKSEFWIVLPDRRTIFWRWGDYGDTMGLDFDTPLEECASDPGVYRSCSGAVISSRGRLTRQAATTKR